jgi:hypothetical protein
MEKIAAGAIGMIGASAIGVEGNESEFVTSKSWLRPLVISARQTTLSKSRAAPGDAMATISAFGDHGWRGLSAPVHVEQVDKAADAS